MFTSLLFAAILGHRQAPAPTQGVGDLLIAPTRVVLDTTKRNAEVNLLNTGDKAATYRISFIHQRMNADGKLEDVTTPGPDEKFADDLVRFTPRQVVLEPHVAQLVRIQLRLPADLAAGEYRSHLLFRAVPAATAADEPAAGAPAKGIDIKITPIYGVSIPVIVRSGETSSTVTMQDLHLVTTPEGVQGVVGKLSRTGNASSYGQLSVSYAPRGGSFKSVGQVNGVAVYTPNASRNFGVRLTVPDGEKLAAGTIRVTYRQVPSEGERVLAEATFDVP